MTDLTSATIATLRHEALEALAQVADASALEAWRVHYLGRKGAVPQFLRQLKELPAAERRVVGEQGNQVRQELEQALAERQQQFSSASPVVSSQAQPDVVAAAPGHLHPLTLTIRRIEAIFTQLGFTMVEGPLVEDPRYNFDFLNISPEHPARAETDTFYLTNGAILRTHVSPLQIRGPKELGLKPPFQIFYCGRCFRAEKKDATHEDTFHQFEFMVVNETVSLAELKGIVQRVYSDFFGRPTDVRLRPAYFPFVEPGLEVDIGCVFCQQQGCAVCKWTGWIEMAGAGMVQPVVLQNIGVDPGRYQGIAMGAAIDRLAMLRYGISDIRLFWSGDLKFLRQFS